MIPHLFYYQLVILGLLWLFVILHSAWPSRGAPVQGTSAQPITPRRQLSKDLKPFAGLTHKPFCAACEHDSTLPQPPPPVPPDPRPATHRRPRQVDTSKHFCPHARCAYRGWLGLGNLRANGLPTICQAECVTFFAPSALLVHNESGWHHSTYNDAAWPSGYAGVGHQYGVRQLPGNNVPIQPLCG